ncbi:transcriptional regulator, AsnC family [Burkholderia multivorans CGD2M]|uniref:Transcriptional regulator, AsnC family n=1 Tax=Burkholderia multivorans CGD2 TaxID=513052 RepID=B9BY93_9BURK|nr:transcriptional regulator, AsnC family [Burkholderia multivorans CGD2]EEE14511.1 transcriptional regulator, AsnC family [Burkholderia multivorans CGD2M]
MSLTPLEAARTQIDRLDETKRAAGRCPPVRPCRHVAGE